MNYFLEITKKVEEFCNTSPSPDLRGDYLKTAEKVSELDSEATILAEEGISSNDERIISIYEKICKLLEG